MSFSFPAGPVCPRQQLHQSVEPEDRTGFSDLNTHVCPSQSADQISVICSQSESVGLCPAALQSLSSVTSQLRFVLTVQISNC